MTVSLDFRLKRRSQEAVIGSLELRFLEARREPQFENLEAENLELKMPVATSTAPDSALQIGRRETHALAKQAWRMGKRGLQLRGFRRFWLRHQERLQSATQEALEAEQLESLRRILSFAGHTIPHYRDAFRNAGVEPEKIRHKGDLRRLPLLTRNLIRQGFPDRLVHPGKSFRSWMLGRTSGSTSESLSFIRPDDRFRRSLYYSVLWRTGGSTDTQVFVLSTPICTPNTCSLQPEESDHRTLARSLHRIPPIRHLGGMVGLPSTARNILTAGPELFEEIHRQLVDGPPPVIIADPVYLAAFARYLRRAQLTPPKLRAIISTYELLTPSTRDLLAATFGCEISSQYGSSEINDIADTCEHGQLHVRMDEVLVETLRDGRPAVAGELARVVVTDLRNFNMPFIRYDIGDVVRVADEPCPCGRKSQLLGTVEGRARDIINVSGRLLTPLGGDAIFQGVEGIAAYELVQTATRRFRLSWMEESPGPGLCRENLEARARGVLGDDAKLRLRVVEEIEPQASNKYRFVYSRGGEAPVAVG